ncbi:WlaTC/HtrL family glycosyltransferase [Parabacteroides johnsonii]|uniref:WlaTC/HtrL family glycosyltransferase n=1 Tax=Parabacteroides johnsonii TaxID=387661 RepID=UPI001899575E|nr:WlaTC/HtrL family glycosyltransferase [Parabacteroides johnsonii]
MTNSKEITLVTAFFNIGRENFKAIPRKNDTYLNNFEFWARIRNKVIIYTSSVMVQPILEIRKKFNQENNTIIVPIDDIEMIEPEILNKMEQIKDNTWFERFRILPNATSNIPRYSYLMLLKTWFLQDAVTRGYAQGQIAWFDFGFNHGGRLYTNPEQFDFKWQYGFSDKIHFFYYQAIDSKPIYETVRRLADSIMGCLYIVPDHYCVTLWNLTKNAMKHLVSVDLYDDDQLLLLMAYRSQPEIFELHQSDWFRPLHDYGASHLQMRETIDRPKYKQIVINFIVKYKRIKLAFRNSIITFKDLICKD